MSTELAALNKQAINAARQHMNQIAWPTVLLVAFVLISMATVLGLFVTGQLSAWIAAPLVGALTYMSYTPLHEAAHGNVHGGRDEYKWLNDLCGYLVAPIIWVPYASHTVEHFTHHRFTNQPDKDPDHVVSNMAKGPVTAFFAVIRFLWVQNSFFVQNHWGKATKRERLIYTAEISLAVAWRVGFIAMFPEWSTVAVIVVGYLLGGFFTAYWFAYRPHQPYEDSARYRNTKSMIMPLWMKPLEWFWLGQNLHSIHHLFPRVPFYRYHALHREIEPIMRAHGTPIEGIFDRKPIGPAQ